MTSTLIATSLLAATTKPTLPADKVPDVEVTPGVAGFIAIAVIAVATILLIVDMTRRIRRTRYRVEARERIEAEARAALMDVPVGSNGPDETSEHNESAGGPTPR